MAITKKRASKKARARGGTAPGALSVAGDSVATFLRALRHPLKAEIDTVRRLVLGASPEIREAIKWNSISFQTSEFFATVNLRSKHGVQLVFHRGAKTRKSTAMDIADPEGIVEWLAKDRCLVTLGGMQDIRAKRAAFVTLVKKWIKYL